jgi:hypothetical protein
MRGEIGKFRALFRERGLVGGVTYCAVHAASMSNGLTRASSRVVDLTSDRDVFVRKGIEESFSTLIEHERGRIDSGGLTNELIARASFVASSSGAVYCVTDLLPAGSSHPVLGQVIANVDGLSEQQIRDSVFHVYFQFDEEALPTLRRVRDCGGRFVPPIDAAKTPYRFVSRSAHEAISSTWSKREAFSHFDVLTHENICEAIEISLDLDGDFLEIGVFRGGSAHTALRYLEARARATGHAPRRAVLIDTFDGFNYLEAATSVDAIWEGTHQLGGADRAMNEIASAIGDVDVEFRLVRGNIIVDPIPEDVLSVSVANIDVDMYEPTRAALERVHPLMQVGGVMILEDPPGTPALYGAFMAMRDFLETESGSKYLCLHKGSQYLLLKRA